MQARATKTALTQKIGHVCLSYYLRRTAFQYGGRQWRRYSDSDPKAEKEDGSSNPPIVSDRVRAILSSDAAKVTSQAVALTTESPYPSRDQNIPEHDPNKAPIESGEDAVLLQEKFLAQRRNDAAAYRASHSSNQSSLNEKESQDSMTPVATKGMPIKSKTPRQMRNILTKRKHIQEQLGHLMRLIGRSEKTGRLKQKRIEGISRHVEQFERDLEKLAHGVTGNESSEKASVQDTTVTSPKKPPQPEKKKNSSKKDVQSVQSVSKVKALETTELSKVKEPAIGEADQKPKNKKILNRPTSADQAKEQTARKGSAKKPRASEDLDVEDRMPRKVSRRKEVSSKLHKQLDTKEDIPEKKAGAHSSTTVKNHAASRNSKKDLTGQIKRTQTGSSEIERKARLARTLETQVQRLRAELQESAAEERRKRSKLASMQAATKDFAIKKHPSGPASLAARITSQFIPNRSGVITGEASHATGQNNKPESHAGFEQFVSLTDALKSEPAASAKPAKRGRPSPTIETRLKLSDSPIETIEAADLGILPLDVEQPPVPSLAYGLERVLFNPGVYQLQDPRSRVYNFDPYLQKIMPVAEFDFNALKEYITSSRDQSLKQIAKEHGKRYVGSTSSMTGALAHFHFLLSQWRPINTDMLSKSFPADFYKFTELQRAPSAIFLRWKEGSYAIDADKQFASANVLSMLGKSMEKLLTLKTNEYERYRRSSLSQVTEEEQAAPESYHYSTQGDFLMRSQLDAHDPRLPGTGMFDLKTRAVVSIRMDVTNYEQGVGYQIKSRQGAYESFEREYYDMIRAAFLKYSMQVRMGRMDGIFVAFHNIERIFGFQYISLPEMDSTIHGQWDTSIGDQEFTLSLDLLNKILDKATKKYPETSLRIHFETRDAATPFMYIFAEPVTEEQVGEIQSHNDAKIQEFERNILGLTREVDTELPESQDERSKWADIEADVEEAMDKDELGLEDSTKEASDEDDVISEVEEHESFERGSLDENQQPNAAVGEEERDIEEDDDEDETDVQVDQEHDIEENDNEDETDLQVDQEYDDEGDRDHRSGNDETEDEEISENEGIGESEENFDSQVVDDPTRTGDSEMVEPLFVEDQNFVLDNALVESSYNEIVDDSEHAFMPATPEDVASVESIQSNTSKDVLDTNNGAIVSNIFQSTPTEQESRETETLSLHEIPVTTSNQFASPPIEEAEEIDGGKVQSKADQPFLDAIGHEMSPETKSAIDTPLLAMTLTLRNKVNNQFVLRPENMTAKDKWSIEYSLAEVTSETRAKALYEACQARRQKKLDMPLTSADEATVNYYIQNLRNISAQGAKWRKQQDQHDRHKTTHVLGRDDLESAVKNGEEGLADNGLEA